ncbi:MAG: polysaccharide biosynthesis tyrosine autokinase [Verrucomicrobia bacterium]|nr:polysaccharide biosynthesis tyrosine autokinase [Verrucomicrobiota bacterium]MDA1087367.1 polysaccharide biosynthesis tyrosine autokinase [Verrucomicrobiota bacterium]
MHETGDDSHFLDYWRVLRSRKELVIAIVLMVVIAGALITIFAIPKVYKASTRIKIERRGPDIQPFGGESVGSQFTYLAFLKTEFEVIMSRRVLSAVVQELNLEEQFQMAGRPGSFQRARDYLARNASVQLFRDTNLVEIQVYMSMPEDNPGQLAATIANTIARVYERQRDEVNRKQIRGALKALDDEYKRQAAHVKALEQRVADIRKTYNIVGDADFSTGTLDADQKIILQAISQHYAVVVAQSESRRVFSERVKAMSDRELLNSQEFTSQGGTLRGLTEQRDADDLTLAEMQKALAENHPRVISLKEKLTTLNAKIQDKLDGLRRAVELDAVRSASEVAALEKKLVELRADRMLDEDEGYRKLKEATQELDRQERIAHILEVRIKQVDIEQAIPHTIVEVVDIAEVPDMQKPDRPNLLLNLLISIVVGLASGVGVAFFMEYIDTSIRTVEDIERHIGASVLGIIPQKVLPLIEEGPSSPHAEAYRVIRTNLSFSKGLSDGANTLCVTSGSVGEGKSLTTANLAFVNAQLGQKTLIIDADLRRPRQHKMFNLSNRLGLANVLLGEMDCEDAVMPTSVPNLFLMPSGRLPSAAHGVLDASRMRKVIDDVRKTYDFVFLDSPPILGVSDASVLASEAAAALLVIQYRKYPRSVSARARTLIDHVGGNLAGVVLNNINVSRDSYYYYYYHTYYSTYQRAEEDRAEEARAEEEATY